MSFTLQDLQTGLGASLTSTVILLGIALLLAHKHRVKAHIAFIGLFLISFLVTLYFAETLGRRYAFNHISYPIHLSIAIFTTGFALAPLITGFLHWRGKAERTTHTKVAWVWGACIVASLGTGGWMMSHGTLKAETAGADSEIAPVTSNP